MSGKAQFVKSARLVKDFPEARLPEVAMTGRSNAGKSSLLNALLGHKLVKVSAQPGKTRLLNFFDYDEEYRFVDMPGYGYAARSQDEREDYKRTIESYFSVRSTLVCLILILDARRDWTDEEQMVVEFAKALGRPVLVVANKIDKLNQGEKARRLKKLKEDSGIDSIFGISSTHKIGVDQLKETIYRQYIVPFYKNKES